MWQLHGINLEDTILDIADLPLGSHILKVLTGEESVLNLLV